MSFLGDLIDNVGTALNLPEFGLSESVPTDATSKKGEASVNTGRVPFQSSWLGTSNTEAKYNDALSKAPVKQVSNPVSNGASSVQGGTVDSGSYGAYGTSGGSGGSSAYSADDLAYIDDQIAQLTGQKARIATGLQQGLTGLEDSYNKNVSSENGKRSRAIEDFNTQTDDTTRNKNSALGKVDTNARILSDSLRRRLGMAGGSDSSAYQITAPGAVARDASADRTGVVEDFGVNFRNLDTAKKRADTDFSALLEDLSAQRRNSERGLRQGIMEQENQVDTSLADASRQRAGLLGGGYNAAKLASAGYESGINNRNAQIDSLFNQYRNPYTVKPVDVQKVNLRDYLVDKAAIQTNQAAGTEDPYAPYTPELQKKDEYQY